ncbi:SSI family serine proteinase inhibitor [Arthrobacter sp.]|uniref:SSI family serine proteinase inhibitor n=1 Tax=Arthrobacter sp. TaxID=1667 RepID=UPI003390B83E
MAVRSRRSVPRRARGLRTAAFIIGLLAVPSLAACGQGNQPAPSPGITAPASPGTGSPGSPGTSEPAPPNTQEGTAMDADLTIVLTSAGSEARVERKLVCRDSQPADGSTVRDADAACAALSKHGEKVFFELPDRNRICTQQYGGPQQARVTGTISGREVDKQFSLTDGCQISEWNSMQALLGSRAGEA